ncbi:uncharacterized protein CBL_02508 [Carabus blaptoides fortunei]
MSKEQKIFSYLYELGCCKICCLRYLCVRNPDIYENVDKYIKEKQLLVGEVDLNEHVTKKLKSNPCIVCLGLLQDFCIGETVDKVASNGEVSSYDSIPFTCSVSFPACIQLREHSMRLNLEKIYPDFYTFETMETQINKAWKWAIRHRLAEKLNKTFENSETCDFAINIIMGYEFDTEELSVLLKMQPDMFSIRQVQHRKFRGELFSRKGVQTALSKTNAGVFYEHATVPPAVPTKGLTCDKIECNHNSIYLAGRYCKYSRELSQTPWVINGFKTMESSVQEILFEPVQKFLNIAEDGLKFCSSGREDVDVRCLGRGRPFVIELLNPKKTQFTFDEFRTLENEVNKSELINIRDLQLVHRNELVHIKSGEETKSKNYEALCVCKEPVTQDMIDLINKTAPVELKQKTPIRVLHRRPLAVRDRVVYSMRAELVPGKENLFKLHLTTQAGTYVKEFVHGDFGRTIPSLKTILDKDIDIVALDVTAINLDWPTMVMCS